MLVQCKHSRRGRTIGVSVLRELVGVSIHFQTKRVALVTNSLFSAPLSSEAQSYRHHGFEVSLTDGSALLRMLEVYEPCHPDLQVLTTRDLLDLELINRRLLDGTC